MIALSPSITTWLDRSEGPAWPLPSALMVGYGGPLDFPVPEGRPYVIANFVATLDGVTSYGLPGQADGGPISGFNRADLFIMGLLRACADAIIVGAETVRQAPRDHLWTPEHIFPEGADDYTALRRALGKAPSPATVIVTGRGALGPDVAALHATGHEALVVTTKAGTPRLAEAEALPATTRVLTLGGDGQVSGATLLDAVVEATGARLVLTEGGAHLLGTLVAERQLDELFLTVAPQIAGREPAAVRPALVEGIAFVPASAPWARLVSGKACAEHLFLRYRFESDTPA